MSGTPQDTQLREKVVMMANSDSESDALKDEENKAEICIAENQGIIRSALSKIPGPFLGIVKGVLRIILLPIRILATIPFRGIYKFLSDFVSGK